MATVGTRPSEAGEDGGCAVEVQAIDKLLQRLAKVAREQSRRDKDEARAPHAPLLSHSDSSDSLHRVTPSAESQSSAELITDSLHDEASRMVKQSDRSTESPFTSAPRFSQDSSHVQQSHVPSTSRDSALSQRMSRAAKFSSAWRKKTVGRTLVNLEPYLCTHLLDQISMCIADHSHVCQTRQGGSSAHNTEVQNKSLRSTVIPCAGAVMIADISGFTALTAELSASGVEGVEILTKCINSYFSKVLLLLSLYNADVMRFAGDSMIILFRARGADGIELRDAALTAVQCGEHLVSELGFIHMQADGT
eukprot:scaffold7932_cov403-Prasinococcus_capsulatus_cf.AAC.1